MPIGRKHFSILIRPFYSPFRRISEMSGRIGVGFKGSIRSLFLEILHLTKPILLGILLRLLLLFRVWRYSHTTTHFLEKQVNIKFLEFR